MKKLKESAKRISDPILQDGIGSLPERIKQVMNGDSNRVFAEKIGVSEGTVRLFANGGSIPRLDDLMVIASVTGCDFHWLATGTKASPQDKAHQAHESESTHYAEEFDEEYVLIDGYHCQVSAGHGSNFGDNQVKRRLAFRRKWLQYRHLNPDNLKVVFAKGDSMEPTIHSGDSLAVDISCNGSQGLIGGAIYIIRMGEHLYAKRIEQRIDGGIDIISDNTAYTPQTLTKADLEDLQVIGKVIWIGKDVHL